MLLTFKIRYPERPIMILGHSKNSSRKFVKLSLTATFVFDRIGAQAIYGDLPSSE